MTVVNYKDPSGKAVKVYNPRGYDYPLTIQVSGQKCTYDHQSDEPKGKPPRGSYYFRPMSTGERIKIAQTAIESEINAMLERGEFKKPQDKRERIAFENFITRSKLSKAPQVAENYKKFLVVDIW